MGEMLEGLSFVDLLRRLRSRYESHQFEYSDPQRRWSTVVREHFKRLNIHHSYGAYVVRARNNGRILYIGKAGTLTQKGEFKGQDMVGRLTNIRGKVRANVWFSELCRKFGPIEIEYFILSKKESPAYIEAALLQVYFNEYGNLPSENKSF